MVTDSVSILSKVIKRLNKPKNSQIQQNLFNLINWFDLIKKVFNQKTKRHKTKHQLVQPCPEY